MPAPTHQSHGLLVIAAGLTTAAIPVPSGVTGAANEAIVVQLYKENTAGITPPAGFTQKSQVATDGVTEQTIFWKRPSGADAGTYDFTWTGSTFAGGSAHRITGVGNPGGDPFHLIDHEFSNSLSSTTPAVQFTTTVPDILLLWLAMGFDGSNSWTQPGSFTEVFESTNLTAAWKVHASAADTGALTGSSTNTDKKAAFLGALLGTELGPGMPPVWTPQWPGAGPFARDRMLWQPGDTTHPADQTITLGLVTETESSLSVTLLMEEVLGQPSETETAQAVTMVTPVPVAQAIETETAQATATAKDVAVGLVTETESSQAVTAPKTVALGQPTEVESSQATTTPKTVAAGLTTETESSQVSTTPKAVSVGQPAEAELSQAVTAPKAVVVGQPSETESAQTITVQQGGTQTIAIGQVAETESSQAVLVPVVVLVGQKVEVEQAQVVAVIVDVPPPVIPPPTPAKPTGEKVIMPKRRHRVLNSRMWI